MAERKDSQGIEYPSRYWLEVSAIGFFCTILWLLFGMVYGRNSGFHEWEMTTIGLACYIVPVALMGSWVLAVVAPRIAIKRLHIRPFETAKWVVVAWTLLAVVIPFVIVAL